jgi:hypothetical protein
MEAEAWRRKSALPPGMRRHPLFIFNGSGKLFSPLAIHEVE